MPDYQCAPTWVHFPCLPLYHPLQLDLLHIVACTRGFVCIDCIDLYSFLTPVSCLCYTTPLLFTEGADVIRIHTNVDVEFSCSQIMLSENVFIQSYFVIYRSIPYKNIIILLTLIDALMRLILRWDLTWRAVRMLGSACPYVSWQWTAKALIGTSFITICSILHMEPGVPTPMVSPREIS